MLPNLKNATRALYGMSGCVAVTTVLILTYRVLTNFCSLSNIMDMMRPNAGDSMEYDLTYAPISPRVETGTKTVIVQMFQWDWCASFVSVAMTEREYMALTLLLQGQSRAGVYRLPWTRWVRFCTECADSCLSWFLQV